MSISKNEIEKITLGALRIEERDGFLTFSRFTKKQDEMFVMRGEGVVLRACSTASIKLEFWTKGGEISFDYKISPGIKREYYSIDLLVNKVYKFSLSKDTNKDFDTFKYYIPETEKEQKITVYFPTTACIQIKNFKLPQDAMPHRRDTKILVLGDSLYQGYNPNHFQNTCMNILADFYDAEMINQSIGGDCFNKNNLDKINFEPDFIIVGYGINDWASGRFKNGEAAKAYFERVNEIYPQTLTFVILPPSIDYLERTRKNDDLLFKKDENFGNQTIEDIRNMLFEIVKYYKNIIPINAKDFIPQYSECFYSDNVHLTDHGNYIYGNKLINEITKHYKKN